MRAKTTPANSACSDGQFGLSYGTAFSKLLQSHAEGEGGWSTECHIPWVPLGCCQYQARESTDEGHVSRHYDQSWAEAV